MAATITLSNASVAENEVNGHIVGTLGVTESQSGESFTYALSGTSDLFEIKQDTTGAWVLAVKNGSLIDFETTLTNLIITATSTATTGPKTNVSDTAVTITVTDVNEAPTDLTVTGGTISQDAAVGTEVATLVGVDPDARSALTYSFVTDATGATAATSDLFEIAGDKVKLKAGLDQAHVGSQQVWVKVTDGEFSYVEQVTFTVTDALEVVDGSSKNDKLYGTANADSLNGGAGNDKIYGLDGDDFINGGAGKDMLYGGAGLDTFVFDFKPKKGHFDQIKDFNVAEDTIQIDLEALQSFTVKVPEIDVIGATKKGGKPDGKPGKKPDGKKSKFSLDKVLKEGKLEKKFFKSFKKESDLDSNDFLAYNKKTGVLYLDLDGSGSQKGIEILKVKPGTALSVNDIVII